MLDNGFARVGKDFPVFLDDVGNQIALARTERSTVESNTDFDFDYNPEVTIEEDLFRRDFTMNAIAVECVGEFEAPKEIDPYGGREDIKNKTIRHVSKHFCEDPLRVLRAYRFSAQLGFSIHEDTRKLCRKMVKDKALSSLSKERIIEEIYKIFTQHFSTAGTLRYMLEDKVFDALGIMNSSVGDDAIEKVLYNEDLVSEQKLVLFLKSCDRNFNSYFFSERGYKTDTCTLYEDAQQDFYSNIVNAVETVTNGFQGPLRIERVLPVVSAFFHEDKHNSLITKHLRKIQLESKVLSVYNAGRLITFDLIRKTYFPNIGDVTKYLDVIKKKRLDVISEVLTED